MDNSFDKPAEGLHCKENMKSKAAKYTAKYTEHPNTVNAKSLPVQSPITRNKGRSVQVNSVRSQASSVQTQSPCGSDKMQHVQENSVGSKSSTVPSNGTHESNKSQTSQENSTIAKASSVASQTVYDSKFQRSLENHIGSKSIASQSTCDSSMILGENEQLTATAKGHKLICPNGHINRFEEKNATGNVCQNARGQNEVLTSVKCDTAPSQVSHRQRGVDRHTYSSARNENVSYVTFHNITSKVSPVISARYTDQRESQNHCADPKIADLRRGFVHHQTKNGSEIECQNEVKTTTMGFSNSELTHQEQQPITKIKEADNPIQVDSSRQIRDGSSNSELRPIPAKEIEQVSQLDLPSSRSNGTGAIGTHIATLTGNSLTIKGGSREVVLVFMNPSQSVIGRGGQTAETDHCNIFQEREIPATTKSLPAPSTATNSIDNRIHQHEMSLQSTCDTTGNEANTMNENSSCEKNSTFKIRDLNTDQVNGDRYRHSFRKYERPTPISLQPHRSLLCPAITEPQTNMGVGASGAGLEQSAVPSIENAVDNRRDLVPVGDSSAQAFSRTFDASDACIGNTENLLPVREVSAQTLTRNCCRNEVYTGNSMYQNSGLQMQFPSLATSSACREDAHVNERSLLCDTSAAYHYGRDQLSIQEEPVSAAHFQTQVPLMGQHCLYGRLPSYGHHALRNPYREDFIDTAPEPAYHMYREPIGVLRCRRFGSSYSGHYAYHLPPRNPERAHRTSFLDMRPHIYHRPVYPEQQYYGYIDSGNMSYQYRY